MKYVTEGGAHYPLFVMPAAIQPNIDLPDSSENCYAILFWRQGTITLEDESGNFVLHGAGALCLSRGHAIRSLSFQNEPGQSGGAYTLVFKPDSLNTNYSSFPSTTEYSAVVQALNTFIYKYLAQTTVTRLENLCKDINYQMNIEKGVFWPCLARSYILELLILIERTAYTNNTIHEYSLPQCDEQMQKVFQYIHTSYSDDISLDSLAKRFATNRTSLNELFKTISGMTVMAYLGNVRLSVASLLLQNTTLSIQTIAHRVGLNDEAYFSRLFKTKKGISPRDFRMQHPHPYGNAWSNEDVACCGNA